jgi:hypothetical protein
MQDIINKVYMKGCYLCENEVTEYCDGCPVKNKILELEEQQRKSNKKEVLNYGK